MYVGRSAFSGTATSESGGWREFSFRLLDAPGEGLDASAGRGLRATIIRAASASAVLEVDGQRIEIDGPLGGRSGKHVEVRIRSLDPPLIEIFSRAGASRGTSPTGAGGAASAGSVPASNQGGLAAGGSQAAPDLPSAAVVISQSRSGTERILLAGVQEQGPFPVQPGEKVPLKIIGSDATHSLLALRGKPLLLGYGGLTAGGSLWAEVVSGPEYPVLRLRVAQGARQAPGRIPESLAGPSPTAGQEAPASTPAAGQSASSPVGAAPRDPRTAQVAAPEGSSKGADTQDSEGERLLQQSTVRQQTIQAAAARALLRASTQGLLRAGDFPALPRGTLLTARVLRHIEPGRTLLIAHGVRFVARVPQGAAEGEKLLLQVESSTPRTLLSVVDRLSDFESAVAAILRGRLALKLPMGESAARLTAQLEALPEEVAAQDHLQRLEVRLRQLTGRGSLPTPSRLAALIDNGGLQYESKLARAVLAGRQEALQQVSQSDLKGLLLETLQRSQATSQDPLAQLTGAVSRHLANIESGQAANLLSLAQSQGLQLELPLALGSQLATLHLSLRPDGEDQKSSGPGGRGYHIVFLLQLDALGETRVDAYSTGHALRAELYVERPEAVAGLQQQLPLLEERLRQGGFQQVHLRVRSWQEASESSQENFKVLRGEDSSGPTVRLIDVRA